MLRVVMHRASEVARALTSDLLLLSPCSNICLFLSWSADLRRESKGGVEWGIHLWDFVPPVALNNTVFCRHWDLKGCHLAKYQFSATETDCTCTELGTFAAFQIYEVSTSFTLGFSALTEVSDQSPEQNVVIEERLSYQHKSQKPTCEK